MHMRESHPPTALVGALMGALLFWVCLGVSIYFWLR